MTKQEAWVRFMAGAMARAGYDVPGAAYYADAALREYEKRWPEAEREKKAEEGGKDDA